MDIVSLIFRHSQDQNRILLPYNTPYDRPHPKNNSSNLYSPPPPPCYTVAHTLKYKNHPRLSMQEECHSIREGFFARECFYLH